MNNTIDKKSFYKLLESVLNKNYDDDFKFVISKRDLSDYGTDILGTKYIYFIEDGSKRRYYESTAETVEKRKIGGSYMKVSQSSGTSLSKEGVELLLTPHVMQFPVTMIIPDLIDNLIEKTQGDVKKNILEEDKNSAIEATVLYNAELNSAKSKVRKRFNKK